VRQTQGPPRVAHTVAMPLVFGQHGDAYVNRNGRRLLQLYFNNALCIVNTFYQHINLHRYTWCRDSLGQRSL